MAVYVMRDGVCVDKETGEPMNPPDAEWIPGTPEVMKPQAEYKSPITGERIGDRRQRSEDLKRHGCIDANDMRPADAGQFRNPHFMKKWGLQHKAAPGAAVKP